MASTAPRLSAGMNGLQHHSPRRPLMHLTMNPKVRRQHRIVKPAQATQTSTRNIRRNATQRRREFLQLCPEQRDRAVAIYNKLQQTEHFANRAPTLHSLVNGGVELEYPQYRFWRLLADPSMPTLTRVEVQQLRETVVRYTNTLYDAGIPYAPDLTTLEVVSKSSKDPMARPMYRPFLNTFDFDVDPHDRTIPWAELKDTKLRRVTAQFAVLEMLAELSNPSEAQKLSLGLEPSIVAGVLRELRPPVKRNLAIRHITTYSVELGQFVIDFTGQYLRSLSWRLSHPMLTLAGCLDYCETVSHILRVLDNSRQGAQTESGSAFSDRGALLIMRAALLVHCYAKTVTVTASHGLLEASEKNTVDSYATNEHFTSATQARHAAEKEIHELAEQGHQLDEEILYFVRVNK